MDHEGTALMFHSWLECSAKGPVFIWKRKSRTREAESRGCPGVCPCSPAARTHIRWGGGEAGTLIREGGLAYNC